MNFFGVVCVLFYWHGILEWICFCLTKIHDIIPSTLFTHYMRVVCACVRFSVWICWGLSYTALMSGGVHHKFPHELQTLAQCHTVLFGWPNKSSFLWHLYHKLNKLCVRSRCEWCEWVWRFHSPNHCGISFRFFLVNRTTTPIFRISTHFSISPSHSHSDTFWNSPHKHAKHEWLFWLSKVITLFML